MTSPSRCVAKSDRAASRAITRTSATKASLIGRESAVHPGSLGAHVIVQVLLEEPLVTMNLRNRRGLQPKCQFHTAHAVPIIASECS